MRRLNIRFFGEVDVVYALQRCQTVSAIRAAPSNGAKP